ncbi:acyl-CoA thioesterase [Mesoflavibacter zeaxanthinifaciens subsp. sabulilitoris]|uniref:Acyl-CoA thioesterase n=1 Tax=Mesoflavibacter zeaxanthinifaciens subsp. sabulilitoris TaxID=1520893 RepID=A0A2T1NHC1_9FLAO|nr:thioesterase family protein [Mesoflavibacter zeaxanthinifaciens]PSG92277.1 acyl-CoA thioesterase [Mesoflavibacter zeaxanthinifaciens subsp. sabulilitoris]
MKPDEIEIRVRYAETDQMGVVHHGNYALYLEMARIEWLRKLGISYKSMEENGIGLPVVSLSINFKKSAFYDDVIKVKTQLKKQPTALVNFDYILTNQNDELLCTAEVVLAFMDMKTKRPTRPPKYFLEALKN